MSQEFTLDDVFHGLWSRKTLALATLCTTITIVGVATVVCPKSYTSEAKLFVRLGRENVVLDPTATLGQTGIATAPLTRDAEMNSIAEMISSRQILGQVVDRVGVMRLLKKAKASDKAGDVGLDLATDVESATDIDSATESDPVGDAIAWLKSVGVLNDLPPRESAINKLGKTMVVEVVEESNVVRVSYETHTPEVAQEVVAALTDLYLQEHRRLNRTEGALELLTEQTHRLRTNLEKSEQELRDLKDQTGILSVSEDRFVLLERLGKLRDNLLKSRATDVALDAKIASLKRELQEMPATMVIESRTGAGNQGADGMRQQLFELEMQSKALAASLTEDHPQLQRVRDEVTAVSKMLEEAEAGRVEQVLGPNAVFEKAKTELVLEETRAVAIKSEIAALEQQIKQVQKEIADFTRNEVLFSKLQRQVSVMEEDYRKSAQSQLQVEIDESLQRQEVSNISIAQAATLNPKPSFPNKLLNLVFAMALGCVNAVGLTALLEYRNPALSPERLSDEFDGIPVISERRLLVGTPAMRVRSNDGI